MTLTRPLPGIRFEPQAQPLRDTLPRMDIPLFAGFAASGPLHRPVAVEDVAQFGSVFGGDVELPRPSGARQARTANLAAAVRAFFRNGGRRCWVVRVAGAAALSRFRLPGLVRVLGPKQIEPALAPARSEGSWADALRVQTNLRAVALRFAGYDHGQGLVDVGVASPRDVVPGDLVRLTWPGAAPSLSLFVQKVQPSPVSSPGGTPRLRLTGASVWLTEVLSPPDEAMPMQAVGSPPSPPAGTPIVERLTFDLTVRREGDQALRIEGLGFTPEHPRYFGALPSDELLFADTAQFADGATPTFRPTTPPEYPPNVTGGTRAPDSGWPELWRDALEPRFPLAATLDGAVYLPAGMTTLFSKMQPAEPASGTTLERDGLVPLDASLFLDPDLRDADVRDVLDRADALRYRATPPRTLHGLHSALGLDEVTMIAAPDAVHRGWFSDAVGFDSPLSSPLSSLLSSPLASPPSLPAGCDGQPRAFNACLEPVDVPLLLASVPISGSYELTWKPDPSPADPAVDTIVEATRSDFADQVELFSGASGRLSIHGRAPGLYFYRIRRTRGVRTSDWSLPVFVRVTSLSGWIAEEDAGDDDPLLIDVHRAMIRLCAARGDLTAILSLPRHYDQVNAVAHAAALVVAVPGDAARSYGALWHPWLIGRDEGSELLHESPPDGAVAGVMAARANTRGAWVAPANEPLRGVVALTPTLPRQSLQMLQDAAVNVIRQEPSGFVCLDSDTLSNDDDVRPLNVRRLLILVRRAALRTGNDYVFEPNGEALQGALRRGFESMLESMFLRGAFAGRTARSAFQVTTDETVNPTQGIDAGRLLAEIKIAPSRPLSFLTIRLLQRGEATIAQEGR